MKNTFLVEYMFVNDDKVYSKGFESALDAFRFQGDLVKKYSKSKKKELKYAIYKF